MRTINISVTNEQQEFIDNLVSKLGFANRSEFIRTLIRRVKVNPKIVAEPKVEQLSPAAAKRYTKMVEDIESGKVKAFEANSVKELMEHLTGKKGK